MVILDGTCYHLRADGSATAAAADLAPFTVAGRVRAETAMRLLSNTGRAQLTSLIDNTIRSESLIYGIRVTGAFSTTGTRTVWSRDRKSTRLNSSHEWISY